MSDKPTAPDEKLTAASVFERLLVFMDRPWKAIVVVVLVIVCGIGWIIWTERARIADAVLTSANNRAVINETAFIDDAQRLLRDTRSDMIMLVEVDLTDNLMTDRIGIDPDGNRWIPSTGPQQLLLPASSMPLLVRFLANEVVCTNAAEALNEDAKILATKGFVRICMVAVPPILGVSVGGLIVAWKQAPLPQVEQRAGYVIKAAAMKYATW